MDWLWGSLIIIIFLIIIYFFISKERREEDGKEEVEYIFNNKLTEFEEELDYTEVLPVDEDNKLIINQLSKTLAKIVKKLNQSAYSEVQQELYSIVNAFANYYYHQHQNQGVESYNTCTIYNRSVLTLYARSLLYYANCLLITRDLEEATEVALFAAQIAPLDKEEFYDGCEVIIEHTSILVNKDKVEIDIKDYKTADFNKCISYLTRTLFGSEE